MPTYNQEGFIAEALQSVFRQDYPNVELVVVDDCSTDGTAEVISEVVSNYRKQGGTFSVIFERNNQNLGIVRNYEKAFSLANGELLIDAGGDDVQEPCRASTVVRAFIGSKDTTVSAIVHSGVRIDLDGNYVNDIGERGLVDYALGCVTCYHRDVVNKFQPIVETGAWEDVVFGYRASLVGSAVYLPDKLVRRRVGAGASTKAASKRNVLLRHMDAAISARKQWLIDTKWWNGVSPILNYSQVMDNIQRKLDQDCAAKRLMITDDFFGKWASWNALRRFGASRKRLIYMSIFLAPRTIADVLFYLYAKLKKTMFH